MFIPMSDVLTDMVLSLSLTKETDELPNILPSKRLSDLLTAGMELYPEVVGSSLETLVTIYRDTASPDVQETYAKQVFYLRDVRLSPHSARLAAADAMLRLLRHCDNIHVPGFNAGFLLDIITLWRNSKWSFGDCCVAVKALTDTSSVDTYVTLDQHKVHGVKAPTDVRKTSSEEKFEAIHYTNVEYFKGLPKGGTPLIELAKKGVPVMELAAKGINESHLKAMALGNHDNK